MRFKKSRKLAASVLLVAMCSSLVPAQAAESSSEPVLIYQVATGKTMTVESVDSYLSKLSGELQKKYSIDHLDGNADEYVSQIKQDLEIDEDTFIVVNLDTNGDGVPDLNIDTDGDGVPDLNVDLNGDGVPDVYADADGDGVADAGSVPLPTVPGTETTKPNGQTEQTPSAPPASTSPETPSPDNSTEAGQTTPPANTEQTPDASQPSEDEETPGDDDSTVTDQEQAEPETPDGAEPEDPDGAGDDESTQDPAEDQDPDQPEDEDTNEPEDDVVTEPEPETPTNSVEPNPAPSVQPSQPSEPVQPPATNNNNPPSITITPPSQDTMNTPSSGGGGSAEDSSEENNAHNSVVYKGPIKSWSGVDPHSNRYKLKEAAEAMLGWSYSQAIRMTYGYRDCSSFVYTAISDAGFAPPVSWAWTTYTMPSYSDIVYQIPMSELRPGDIVLGDGHVAFYWGNDALGSPMTLECCGTFGVCYGYMMCNGWNFPYTTAWRIRGIDGDDPDYTYSGPTGTNNGSLLSTASSSSATSVAGGSTDNDSSDSIVVSGMAVKEGEDTDYGEKIWTPEELQELLKYHSIIVTPEKLSGVQIDLLDLDIDPVFALQMYLDKYLDQKDIETVHNMESSDDQVRYLLGKVYEIKDTETGQLLANYMSEDLGSMKEYVKTTTNGSTGNNVVSLI